MRTWGRTLSTVRDTIVLAIACGFFPLWIAAEILVAMTGGRVA